MNEDARFELAGVAASHARRNRPRWMPALGSALLAVTLIALVWNLTSAGSARDRLRREQRNRAQVEDLTASIARVRTAANDPSGVRAAGPLNDILQRIQRAGARHELTMPLPHESSNEDETTVERRYAYRLSHPSIADLMGWVRDATESAPGLRVYGLSLTKQGDRAWQLDVTFVRYERAG